LSMPVDMQSDRLGRLPPYLFVEIDRLKKEYIESGREVFDLGIGDPDRGAPPALVKALKSALDDPENHRYPPDTGMPRLKEAVRGLASRYQGVDLSHDEILITIGSKEAIGHLCLAVANPGDLVLVPDPGYPVYNSSAVFAGARVNYMPLKESNDYWPEFEAVGKEEALKARLLYLNYPNNPTAATAEREEFLDAVRFCGSNTILPVNDAAYCDIFYERRPELLFPRAKEAGIPYLELFSFSKTLSITGWRIGYAIGSREVISSLARLKANIDSGVFMAVQIAVAEILETEYEDIRDETMALYAKRREMLCEGLKKGGFEFSAPEATFYFWVKVPEGNDSVSFCRRLLRETGIISTPGVGFGPQGEGYFRLSLTAGTDIIRAASARLSNFASGGRVSKSNRE